MPSKTCPSCRASYPADTEICPRDGSTLQSESEWLPGTIVRDKYSIRRRLNEDEVSVCYEARVPDSDESRVVRILRTEFSADASAVREFQRIGRLLQKVAHPSVVRVEAVDRAEDGRPFLVTELVEAPSLAELLPDGRPFEAARICALARAIAAALEASHRFNLLHLNLQPRNILVTGLLGDEHVKVQGFGTGYIWAARAADGHRSGKTALSDLTPAALAYSSPEQALARSPESLDARSDLYSLGVLLYRMLTGRLPFRSRADGADGEDSGLALLAARLEEAPVAVGVEGGDSAVPHALAALVMQLLERRPELRPATAKAVIDKIGLAEGGMAAWETPAFEFPPPEIEPAPPQVVEGFAAPVAPVLPSEEREAVPAASEPLETASGLDAVVLDSAAPRDPSSSAVPLAASETTEAPAAVVATEPDVRSAGWTSPTSILFREAAPPKPPRRTGWVWVAVVVVVAAGTWSFLRREGLQWLGPGSPKSDQIPTVVVGNPNQPAPSTAPASQPGASGQPTANPVQGAPSTAAGAANPPAPGATSPENPPAPNAGKQETAGTGTTSAAPVSSTAPEVSPPRTPLPAEKGKAGSASEEAMAEVNRAVAAGDVFFELGQYDLAVKAYEGPLKLDPNNKLLHSRIDRALKAKAAEEQFLGQ